MLKETEGNEFVKYLTNLTPNIIQKIHEHEKLVSQERIKKLKNKNAPLKSLSLKLTKEEQYILSVFVHVGNIQITFEYLKYILAFINKFSDKKYFKSKGIDHSHYLQYHLENHYIKRCTLLDQMSILISEVYRLGIPENRVKAQHIKENVFTKNTLSNQLLIQYEKSINQDKSIRNDIIHRGNFQNKDINRMHMFYIVFNDMILNKEERVLTEANIKYEMREVVKETKKIIENKNQEILKYINVLFKILESPFKEHQKNFTKKS